MCPPRCPHMPRSLGLYLRSHSLTLSARVEAFDELNTRLVAPMEFSRSVHSDSVSGVTRLRIHNLVKVLYSRIAYDYRHHEAKGPYMVRFLPSVYREPLGRGEMKNWMQTRLHCRKVTSAASRKRCPVPLCQSAQLRPPHRSRPWI